MPHNPLDAIDVDAIRKRLLDRSQRWPREQIRPGGQQEWRFPGDIRLLRDSIDLNKMRYPIICRLDGVILDGYRRYLALGELDEVKVDVVFVVELVEAVVALSISGGEQRLPHPFAEKFRLTELIRPLRMDKLPIDGPESLRDKGAVLATLLDVERTVYYDLCRLLRWSRDPALPEHVRNFAASCLEDAMARDGAGAASRYRKVRSAVEEAKATSAAEEADIRPGVELPRDLQRTVNTAMHLSGNANALIHTPTENIRRLPATARLEIMKLLDDAMADTRKFRKTLQEE